MGDFKINLSKREYLELKKQALLDRMHYIKEIDEKKEKKEETRDCIVNACADEYGYDGETRLAYCTNFLIPDDLEFDEFYKSTKSKIDCKDYFCVNTIMIHNKVFFINEFGIYRNLEEVEAALSNLYEEESTGQLETLELQEEVAEEKIEPVIEETEEDFFDTLEKKSDVRESVEETSEMFSPLSRTGDTDVERQTEEALEKINYLFQKNDTKEQRIKELEKTNAEKDEQIAALGKESEEKSARITKLEIELDRLKAVVAFSDETINGLNSEKLELQEENSTLKQQVGRIMSAIDEKYGEYEETHKKRV